MVDQFFVPLPQRDESLQKWSPRRNAKARIPDTLPAAAGVLPFTVHDGKVYLLLGREAHRPGFHSGGLYADFGGGVTNKCRTSIECAAQELQEESFKSLMDVSLDDMVRFIRENVWLVVSSQYGKKAPYHMYCVMFPFFDVESIFNRRIVVARRFRLQNDGCSDPERLRLKQQVPEAFQINGRVRKAYLEKSEIKWFSIKAAKKLPMRDEFEKTLVSFKVLEHLEEVLEHLGALSH
tara:strand:- start:267 stop:974 length:708 start_codon:yes stop_codon:yes gene_type:complete